MTSRTPAVTALILRNLEAEYEIALQQANRTDKKAYHLRVCAIRAEIADVLAGR